MMTRNRGVVFYKVIKNLCNIINFPKIINENFPKRLDIDFKNVFCVLVAT